MSHLSNRLRHLVLVLMVATAVAACGKKGDLVPPMAVKSDGTVDTEKIPNYPVGSDPKSLVTPGRTSGPGLGVPPY
ncbi:lipoprotein [Tistrella mobilis]|uniref:LPS translocon maturation chaperone LptM n=1 Tax=Tistrella mobilis TaxID=171437 RepID=UPI00355782DA